MTNGGKSWQLFLILATKQNFELLESEIRAGFGECLAVDRWQVTGDMQHVRHNMWQKKCGQLFLILAMRRKFWAIGKRNHSIRDDLECLADRWHVTHTMWRKKWGQLFLILGTTRNFYAVRKQNQSVILDDSECLAVDRWLMTCNRWHMTCGWEKTDSYF